MIGIDGGMGIFDWFAAFKRGRDRKKWDGGNFATACCSRFGALAVEYGFVSPEQVESALAERIDDHQAGRPRRVIGAIFFEKGWMSPGQIDHVLNAMFKGLEGRVGDKEVFGAAAAAGPSREGLGW